RLKDVRRVGDQIAAGYESLPLFISNAGAVMRSREVTGDGHEATLTINHLAPFTLINMLLPLMEKSAPTRIVVVASQVEAGGRLDFDNLHLETGYEPLVAYRQSKLANVLFTYELA